MTFGWGVPQDQTYAKLLEKKLNAIGIPEQPFRFEVINSGVGNYNTSQEIAYFKERGQHYNPDMVIIGFSINDAEVTPRESKNWWAHHSLLYVSATSFWDDTCRRLALRPPYGTYYRNLYNERQPGWLALQRSYRDLIDVCKKEGIDLRIALLPELHKIGKDLHEFPFISSAIRALAESANIPVIDLLDGLSASDTTFPMGSPGDPHPNALAQESYASQLIAALTKLPPVRRTHP